jgi:hypothetical protein
MKRLVLALVLIALAPFAAHAADEPDLIFRKSTVFHFVSPNDKLATYAIDDPGSRASHAISRCRSAAASRAGSE